MSAADSKMEASKPPEALEADAEALRRNRELQKEMREALLRMSEAEERSQVQLEALGSFVGKETSSSSAKPSSSRDKEKVLKSYPSFFADPKTSVCPPKNLDAVRRHIFKEKYPAIGSSAKLWTEEEEEALEEALRKELIEDAFRRFYSEKSRFAPPAQRVRFFAQVQVELQGATTADLWKMLRYKADWKRVSKHVEALGFQRSPKCCYIHYVHLLHPELTKGPFTKEEDIATLKLVTEHAGYDWDGMARRLPTARTAWRCFARYQRYLNPKLLRSEWSAEESELLMQTVSEFGGTDARHWVAMGVRMGGGRTSHQVRGHLHRLTGERTGDWSRLEIRRLALAVKIFGEGHWHKIAKHIPGRSATHCGRRWDMVDRPTLKRSGNVDETAKFTIKDQPLVWTPEEDEILLEALEKYGVGNWGRMESDLPGRTTASIYRRFQKLNPHHKADVYDLMLATQRKIMPRTFSQVGVMNRKRKRSRSELVASDFAIRLYEEPDLQAREAGIEGVTRLSTGDPLSDRYLKRVNHRRLMQCVKAHQAEKCTKAAALAAAPGGVLSDSD
eukprot:TRINITY_DN24188_c0_g1_i1.p1 TRINITY_DN24188_c0_g1~~TRINITY_DN24188_c0_g1_i1.p1  ORF type:complete len:560 (-),score=111.74 TRINITY_DN24188_c0_g1_i1:297-1976(-)